MHKHAHRNHKWWRPISPSVGKFAIYLIPKWNQFTAIFWCLRINLLALLLAYAVHTHKLTWNIRAPWRYCSASASRTNHVQLESKEPNPTAAAATAAEVAAAAASVRRLTTHSWDCGWGTTLTLSLSLCLRRSLLNILLIYFGFGANASSTCAVPKQLLQLAHAQFPKISGTIWTDKAFACFMALEMAGNSLYSLLFSLQINRSF